MNLLLARNKNILFYLLEKSIHCKPFIFILYLQLLLAFDERVCLDYILLTEFPCMAMSIVQVRQWKQNSWCFLLHPVHEEHCFQKIGLIGWRLITWWGHLPFLCLIWAPTEPIIFEFLNFSIDTFGLPLMYDVYIIRECH